MKHLVILSSIIAVTCLTAATPKTTTDSTAKPETLAPDKTKPAAPRIEVCFVLDTTGSMGGLIEAAKQKIWSICNEIVKAKPTPELKVGLVAFRDRGDEYVTKPFPLTDDIDTVYGHLMEFKAEGGGDIPESVNEALAVAVKQMAWSQDSSVLKMIFLVGDAPPHMDYPNDVKYPEVCQMAMKKDIIINTVECGNAQDTAVAWQKIAGLGEGRFVAIGENGDVAVITTPMDKQLADLNAAIGKTLVPYGNSDVQHEVMAKQARSETVFASVTSAPAASDRLLYNAATKKTVQGGNELVDEYEKDATILDKIKPADLPAPLQHATPPEVEAYLKQKQVERAELQKQIGEISQQREQYLADERKKLSGSKDGFDAEVAKILREEAAKKGLKYE